MPNTSKPIALISVYDKDGITNVARRLIALGYELISSGGTAKAIQAGGLPVTDVAVYIRDFMRNNFRALTERLTDAEKQLFEDCLQKFGGPLFRHRVATLWPNVHGALLGDPTNQKDADDFVIYHVRPIDVVILDFYPLTKAISAGRSYEEIIELTDIGGPTLARSAAKAGRLVVVTPHDREGLLQCLEQGTVTPDYRLRLAAKAELECAFYIFQSALHRSRSFSELSGLAQSHLSDLQMLRRLGCE